MNKVLKYSLTGVLALLIFGVAVVSVICGVRERKKLLCSGVKVVVRDSSTCGFVTSGDVMRILRKSNIHCSGLPVDSIDLQKIEKTIDSRSAVKKCEAFVTPDGKVNIELDQRRPAVRFQRSDGGFYADLEGCLFPLQSSYDAPVLLVDGNIPLSPKTGYKQYIEDPDQLEWFSKMMKLVNYIDENPTWRGKISRITIQQNTELVLTPLSGDEKFLFGQPDAVKEKFSRMEKYYTNIAPARKDAPYKVVDVRYKGQVICRQ